MVQEEGDATGWTGGQAAGRGEGRRRVGWWWWGERWCNGSGRKRVVTRTKPELWRVCQETKRWIKQEQEGGDGMATGHVLIGRAGGFGVGSGGSGSGRDGPGAGAAGALAVRAVAVPVLPRDRSLRLARRVLVCACVYVWQSQSRRLSGDHRET